MKPTTHATDAPPAEGRYGAVVARASPPEFMAAEDVALVLRIGASAARRQMRRGDWGPVARIGRRLFVHRDGFLEAFHARAGDPGERVAPTPKAPPPAWARSRLGERSGK